MATVQTVIPLDLVGYEGSGNYNFEEYYKVDRTTVGYISPKRYAVAFYIPPAYRTTLKRLHNEGKIVDIDIHIEWVKTSSGGQETIYWGCKRYADDTHCEIYPFGTSSSAGNIAYFNSSSGNYKYDKTKIYTNRDWGYPSGDAWVFGGRQNGDRYMDITLAYITVTAEEEVPSGGINGKLILPNGAHAISGSSIILDNSAKSVSSSKILTNGVWR